MSGDGFNPVAFGRLEARVENLSDELEKVNSKLDDVLAVLNRQKGARWAFGTLVALISSGATSAIHQFFSIGGK